MPAIKKYFGPFSWQSNLSDACVNAKWTLTYTNFSWHWTWSHTSDVLVILQALPKLQPLAVLHIGN